MGVDGDTHPLHGEAVIELAMDLDLVDGVAQLDKVLHPLLATDP